MKNKKRRHWNISEDTTTKILEIYTENRKDLNIKKLGYGEIITIAIDNLINDLKEEGMKNIKNRLYEKDI